jgi:hypothetical protein
MRLSTPPKLSWILKLDSTSSNLSSLLLSSFLICSNYPLPSFLFFFFSWLIVSENQINQQPIPIPKYRACPLYAPVFPPCPPSRLSRTRDSLCLTAWRRLCTSERSSLLVESLKSFLPNIHHLLLPIASHKPGVRAV